MMIPIMYPISSTQQIWKIKGMSLTKPLPETIDVLGKDTVCHPSVTVTDGMQICDGMQNSNTVSDGMQNIAPIVHTTLPSSTDAFVVIYYSPKIGGIG
jgi:hypothetical protein